MNAPWKALLPLDAATFADMRLQTIFDCCKWDPQVADVATLANFPLLLDADVWRSLAMLAEQLAQETIAAEQELCQQPKLIGQLGLPRSIQQQWQRSPIAAGTEQDLRVIRFDFHYTTEGWQISEANTDVPSGYIEASGFTQLMAAHYPEASAPGDPAATLAQAILQTVGTGATIALVHATAYTDDRQVMTYLAKHLKQLGLQPHLISPAQLQWRQKRPWLLTEPVPIDFLYRFFPAEWLPNLPRACGWRQFFRETVTPQCNPTCALLSQSKRFPLVWESLKTPLPTWRSLLPETCDPRQVRGADPNWVLKPALGRVGADIGMVGVTAPEQWQTIQRSARQHPTQWVAQRRFELLPLITAIGAFYPCLGIYTVNGRSAGIYGRMSRQPLINEQAQDVAVLINSQSLSTTRASCNQETFLQFGHPTMQPGPVGQNPSRLRS